MGGHGGQQGGVKVGGGSDEVELGGEGVGNGPVVHDICVEGGALLGVLEDGGDLDGSGPVDVVEALAEDEFLEDALLEGGVGVDDLVVVGDGRALVGLLAHQVEVVVRAHQLLRHQRTRTHVPDLVVLLQEEPLAGLHVQHHERQLHPLPCVHLLQLRLHWGDQQLVEETDLVARRGVHEGDDLLGALLVALEVGVAGLQQELLHLVELVCVVAAQPRGREHRAVGRVDGGAEGHQGALGDLAGVETDQHAVLDVAERAWNPEGVAAFGDDLQEYLGGDALEALLVELCVDHDLREHLVGLDGLELDLLVLGLHGGGDDDEADVVLVGDAVLDLLLDAEQVGPPADLVALELEVDGDVGGGGLEGVEHEVELHAAEVDHAHVDLVLGSEDGLVEEVEERLPSLVHRALAAQLQHRAADHLRVDALHLPAQLQPYPLQLLHLPRRLQLAHQLPDLAVLLEGRLDGGLRDLLAPELVEVVGNAGHEEEFGDEEHEVALLPALDGDQGLLELDDGDVVLLLVVVGDVEGALGRVEGDGGHLLELDVGDAVVGDLAVVGHDGLPHQGLFEDEALVLPVLVLVELVGVVDEVQDGLVAHDLLGGVDAQEDALLEVDEAGLETAVHDQPVDIALLLGVEVLAAPSDLNEVQVAHGGPEGVVHEGEQQLGVARHVEHLHLLDRHLVTLLLQLELLLLRRLQREDVPTRQHGVLDLLGNAALELFEEFGAESGVVVGDEGSVLDAEDENGLHGLLCGELVVVGHHLHAPEVSGVLSADPGGEGVQGGTFGFFSGRTAHRNWEAGRRLIFKPK